MPQISTFSEILILNIRYIADTRYVQNQGSCEYMIISYFVLWAIKYACKKPTFSNNFILKNIFGLAPPGITTYDLWNSLISTAAQGRKLHTEERERII